MRVLNYIQGEFVEPKSGFWKKNLSPSSGEVLGSIPLSGVEDVDNAVNAAVEALPEWSALEPKERAEWLDRIADCLESKFEEIAHLESLDTGKPISLSRSVDAVVTEQTRSSASVAPEGAMATAGAVGALFKMRTAPEVTGLPEELASWGVTVTVMLSPLKKLPARVAVLPPTGLESANHS